MKLSFYGAAGEVTGSCSLLKTSGKNILVDCGMFQGSDFNEGKNSDPLAFDPKELNAVIVTHAHLDHVGRLPILVKNGYTGFLYSTPATIELAELILRDAHTIMEYNNRKFGSPILYEEQDIAAVMNQFKAIEYYESFVIPAKAGIQSVDPRFHGDDSNTVTVKFYEAGHIFGSVFVELQAENKKVVFSGDIGNINVPILRDTDKIPEDADLVICESTYGDRRHESDQARREILEEMVLQAMQRGGVTMIPSFSLERTQELLYDLNDLIDHKHKLPRIPIFLDSPLAIGATHVYRKYTKYYDDEASKWLKSGDSLFTFTGLIETETKAESLKINSTPCPKVIIAGAGMMNGGRILHHALRYLSDEKSTLLIIGYQANGTLGRKILDGNSPVDVMGEKVAVHCKVKAIGAFSAHGDRDKLTTWLGSADKKPKKIILNHGEPEASNSLVKHLKDIYGIDVDVAKINNEIEI